MHVDLLNLGSEPVATKKEEDLFQPFTDAAQSNATNPSVAQSASTGDLLQDLFSSSSTTKEPPANNATPNPFFTLDPFDPLAGVGATNGANGAIRANGANGANGANPAVASPVHNMTNSSSVGNFNALNQQSQKSDGDLLGNWDSFVAPNVPSRPMTAPTMPRNASTPNLETKMKDPLADFANFGIGSATAASAPRAPTWGPTARPNPPMNMGMGNKNALFS